MLQLQKIFKNRHNYCLVMFKSRKSHPKPKHHLRICALREYQKQLLNSKWDNRFSVPYFPATKGWAPRPTKTLIWSMLKRWYEGRTAFWCISENSCRLRGKLKHFWSCKKFRTRSHQWEGCILCHHERILSSLKCHTTKQIILLFFSENYAIKVFLLAKQPHLDLSWGRIGQEIDTDSFTTLPRFMIEIDIVCLILLV